MTDKEKTTVMLVDDTPTNLRLLEEILELAGYKTRPFPSGSLALQSAHLSPPSLVLLDINMPEMDGFEVCQAMKTEPSLKDIPIIFISASNDSEDIVKALEYGAVDYVSKPFNAQEVLARVSTHLTLHQLQCELIQLNESLEQTVKQRSQRLYESEERLRYALEATNEGIYDINLKEGTIYQNPWLLNMLELDTSKMKMTPNHLLELVHPDDQEIVGAFIQNLIRGEQNNYQLRYRMNRKNGVTIWVHNKGQIVERSPEGKSERAVGTITDITQQVNFENELKRLTTHDSITNLPNLPLLRELITQKMQDKSAQFGVLYVGFREFEKIMESTDHSVAEQAIKKIAERLEPCVIGNAVLAKLDGPEFAILVNNYVHESDLASIANLIAYYFIKPVKINSEDFLISPHIGISLARQDDSADIILRNAATAMLASEDEEIAYAYHSQTMNLQVQRQIRLENNIEKGIENKEFINYYQPKTSFRTGEITGAEALVRWQHPEHGLVSPFEFIPVAENSGQIHEIGLQVFENAIKDMSIWRKDLDFKGKIAINLSAKQFNNSELLVTIRELFKKYQIDPVHFELEVTESVLLKDIDQTIATLNEFKALGLTVAIDDFGTGYSSLSYLVQLPIDTLKLDKSFIDDIVSSAKSRTVAESIVQLALGLQLNVVAEGIETIEQAELLQKMKCGQCQGYLFSKPVDRAAFTELISQSKFFPLPYTPSD